MLQCSDRPLCCRAAIVMEIGWMDHVEAAELVHVEARGPGHAEARGEARGLDYVNTGELRVSRVLHDFIITENGQTVATVSKAWISLADSYGVDIVDGQNDLLILCSVLALEAEQDRSQEHNRGVGGLGVVGGFGGLGDLMKGPL